MPQLDDRMGIGTQEKDDAAYSVSAIYEFNRRESPTQTRADALKQEASMEIWGLTPNKGNGLCPMVKAYRESHLPLATRGPRGVMFNAAIPPTSGTGTPFEARWLLGTAGVFSRQGIFAAIAVNKFLNLQP